jgi:hypothetical protein
MMNRLAVQVVPLRRIAFGVLKANQLADEHDVDAARVLLVDLEYLADAAVLPIRGVRAGVLELEAVLVDGPPLAVSYDLTDRGRALMPALQQIAFWARENLPEDSR